MTSASGAIVGWRVIRGRAKKGETWEDKGVKGERKVWGWESEGEREWVREWRAWGNKG
jgi:hypothetical protein